MAERGELMRLGFRTAGDWTVQDLESFARAVRTIYDVLLTLRISRELERARYEYGLDHLREMEESAPDPFTHELFHAWRRALKRWSGRSSMVPLLLSPFGMPLSSVGLPNLPCDEDLFESLDLYAANEDRLQLRRVAMSSPGGFNFEGLGELVEQFRELIRDIWFRNRQERTEGDLRIIAKVLELRDTYPNDEIRMPGHIVKRRYLIVKTAESLRELKDLEEQRKLQAPAENLDYEPPENAA